MPKPAMVLWATASRFQARELVAVARRQRLVGRALQQRLVIEAGTTADGNNVSKAGDILAQLVRRRRERNMGDQRGDARVTQQRRQFRAREARIEWHAHAACRHDGVVGFEIFADVRHEQRDAVASDQPKRVERIGEACDAGVECPVGPGAMLVDDGGTIAVPQRQLPPLFGNVHLTSPRAPRARSPRAAPLARAPPPPAGTAARGRSPA
jgi:hypothetical protein